MSKKKKKDKPKPPGKRLPAIPPNKRHKTKRDYKRDKRIKEEEFE